MVYTTRAHIHTHTHTHTHSAPAAARLGADYAAFKKSLLSEGLDSSALYRKFSPYYSLFPTLTLLYYCRKCVLSERRIPVRFIVTCMYVLVCACAP
jgi:hypothetical protein